MRSKLLALALVVLGQRTLWADPPARLGLPDASPETELRPGLAMPDDGRTPRGSPLPPGSGLGAPAPIEIIVPSGGALPPGAMLPPGAGSPPPGIVIVQPSDPYSRMPYPGYPISYPTPQGPIPGGAMPVGARMPAMPGSGAAGAMPMPVDPFVGATGSPYGPCTAGCGRTSHSTGPCGPISDCLKPKCLSDRPFTENLSFFLGLDGAREPIDLGVNGRFGYRLHVHWGLPIVEDWNLGLHLGAGYNHGHSALPLMQAIGGPSTVHQYFFTLGVFQRTELGLNWELAWDFRSDDYYERMDTSQWRGLVSVYLGDCNEVGLIGTLRDRTDNAHLGNFWFNVRSMNQLGLFWRHIWDHQIVTSLSVGVVDEHAGDLFVRPFDSATNHPFFFGADLFVPLSDRLALTGEALFVTPNDTGTVIATLGIAWYPSGRPAAQPRGAFAPLLPTANNTSMPLDVNR